LIPAEDINPLPVRVVQDGLSGDTVLLPVPQPGEDGSQDGENAFVQRIACTTTPFGFPVRTTEEALLSRYLDVGAFVDEAVRLLRIIAPPPLQVPCLSS
jgi:hypothetical protein